MPSNILKNVLNRFLVNFHNLLLVFFLLGIVSCKEPQAQYPTNKSKEKITNPSVIRNKTIYSNEMQLIVNSIKADTTLHFTASEKGFWYAFIDSLSNDSKKIMSEDLINFKIKIESLDRKLIYDWDVGGTISYRVNKEDILPILREGIKLMSPGEKAVFYSPSYLGFGYLGDGNKIGVNQPLRITLEVMRNFE